MANGAVDLRVNVVFFPMFFRESFLFFRRIKVPVELGDFIDWTKVFVWVPVAIDTPCHGQLLCLVDHLHLIDTSVARFATDTGVHVGCMIEVDELWQVVDAFPSDTSARVPTLADRCQFWAFRVDCCQGCQTLVICRAVTIDAGRGRRHCCVGSVKDRVVTVATIHLQLPCVNRVAEGDWLLWLVADIERLRIGNQTTHGTRKDGSCCGSNRENTKKWIDPTREQEPLHNPIGPRIRLRTNFSHIRTRK